MYPGVRRSQRSNKGIAPNRFTHSRVYRQLPHAVRDSPKPNLNTGAANDAQLIEHTTSHYRRQQMDGLPGSENVDRGLPGTAASIWPLIESLHAVELPPPPDQQLDRDQFRTVGLPPSTSPSPPTGQPPGDAAPPGNNPSSSSASPQKSNPGPSSVGQSVTVQSQYGWRDIVDLLPPSDQQQDQYLPRTHGLPLSTTSPTARTGSYIRPAQLQLLDGTRPVQQSSSVLSPHGEGTLGGILAVQPHDASSSTGGSQISAADHSASILELQRRIQALQRESDHYKEVNAVLQLSQDLFERERNMFESRALRNTIGPERGSSGSADSPHPEPIFRSQHANPSWTRTQQPSRPDMATIMQRPQSTTSVAGIQTHIGGHQMSTARAPERYADMSAQQASAGYEYQAHMDMPTHNLMTVRETPVDGHRYPERFQSVRTDQATAPASTYPTIALQTRSDTHARRVAAPAAAAYGLPLQPLPRAPAETMESARPIAEYYVDTYASGAYNAQADAGPTSRRREATWRPWQSAPYGPSLRGPEQQPGWSLPTTVPIRHARPSATEMHHTPYRRLLELPSFGGSPEDWPFFICSYEETTIHYGYTDLDNMGRLQRALVGEAKMRVQGILIRPEHVRRSIETLAKAFGRPETLAESQLYKIRTMPKISENRPDQLTSFSLTVDGMVSLLDGPATDHLLSNSLLLKELTAKLPTYDQRIWAAVARHIGPNPSIRDFARWLADVADDVANIGSTPPFDNDQTRSREPKPAPIRGKHVLLNVASRTNDTGSDQCSYCGDAHHIRKCDAFLKLPPRDRLTETKKRPLCYCCLGEGHLVPSCERRQVCGFEGCERRHHRLLHRAFDNVDRTNPSSMQASSRQNRPSQSSTAMAPGQQSHSATRPAPTLRTNSQNAEQPDSAGTSTTQEHPSANAGPSTVLNCQGGKPKQTLYYRVVPVVLHGPHRRIQTYALLDEGSSVSLIDEDIAKELQLDGEQELLNLQFVGGASSEQQSRKVNVGISGVEPDAVIYDIDTLQTANELALPIQTVDGEDVVRDNPHLANISFATFDRARPTVLLGLEHHFLGVPLETRLGPRLRSVAAARTKLGWVLYGCSGRPVLPGAAVLHTRKPDAEYDDESDRLEQLHALVRQHFTTEDFGVKAATEPIQSDADKRALSILATTTKRVGNRFETGLLWRHDRVKLPNNFNMALRRLSSVESKMHRDPEYARLYRKEIQSYLDKGYARIMTADEASKRTARTWHLPHFAVQNANKPGKFRLVFDAAATVNDVSLNSVLLAGPDLNVSLSRLLFRFRIGRIGVTADVKEMYHQVAVRKEDQDSQRFLWRGGDSTKNPDVYVMQVMTFGSSCSPTSAQFVKNENAKEFASRFPEAADAVQHNHYVDDFVASFRTSDDAQRITAEVIELQLRGGFELRGVLSNCPAVRERFGAAREDGQMVSLEPEDVSQKILGMMWETKDDIFVFQTRFQRVNPAVMDGSRRPTKREVLSVAMSIFDPFGLLADFLLPTKTILQELWRLGVQWDEPIPEQVNSRWQQWRTQVDRTRQVRIARCYSPSILCAQDLQLHIFADASEVAFAAVGYWRLTGPDGVQLSFVAGKVRCAPVKILSVPRLELQAAVLATRLMVEIRRSHVELQIHSVTFWSDSETVLKWLRCDQRRYVPFVAFRVAEVIENAPAAWWRWVPTALNVADDATRVKTPIVFDPKSRWLLGPDWLKRNVTSWPEQPSHSQPEDAPCEELRPRFVGAISSRGAVEFERFSDFIRLTRCVARVRRFVTNVRARPEARILGPIQADEMESAIIEICRQVQCEIYGEEIATLSALQPIANRSKLFALKPYLDEDGLLRLHGRTDAASEEYLSNAAKRPIIMPPKHHVSALIVRHHHVICAHQLTDATIASVRSKFWIPSLRTLAKSVQKSCQTCRVRNSTPRPPFQGQLPADRLKAYARPFTNTGLDFFGPFQVTVGRRREKRWVALFTCLVTRAVHLEVAADLSTDACLICLRNLCHLRGVPAVIRCDNGTNFVGARNELERDEGFFNAEIVQRELAAKGVQWIFNCPLNPEAGGAWERLVQSIKKVLRIILLEEAPRVETFRALLLEAANVVNSRPLTHLAVEPDDPEPITPNHFLMGGPNVATAPNPEDIESQATRRQWKICRGLSRQFWRKFVQDYLPELTRRSKNYPEVSPLSVGDIVIICDEQQPKGRWTRGVITEVVKAGDGAVRTATVKTAHGVFRRPATRLARIDVCPSGGVDGRGAVSQTAAP